MKYFIYLIVIICFPLVAFCQDITGLWKGTMFNDSTRQTVKYELVIRKDRGKYTGYSHTSYVVNDTKYYGIKKINVRIAKDGKIIMQDASLIEYNYPNNPNKNVIQLNVLDLADLGNETKLDGLFVTNRSKDFNSLTGHITIKKVNPLLVQSDLLLYLQKNSIDNYLTAVK